MERKEYLTTEPILRRFKSQFELVNYAIILAGKMIRSGRPCRVKSDLQNPAQLVLLEILNHKDSLDDVWEPEVKVVQALVIEDEDYEDEEEEEEEVELVSKKASVSEDDE